MNLYPDYGWVEVIAGCMYSGKTDELKRRLRQGLYANRQISVFTPVLKNQDYGAPLIIDLDDGPRLESQPVETTGAILEHVREGDDIVAIDEAQFFDVELVRVVDKLATMGYRVIVAGLDTDFRGRPFEVVAVLMAQAEKVSKLQAICMECGADASRSQRLVEGRPAQANEPTLRVAHQAHYEARCRACHMVPEQPGNL